MSADILRPIPKDRRKTVIRILCIFGVGALGLTACSPPPPPDYVIRPDGVMSIAHPEDTNFGDVYNATVYAKTPSDPESCKKELEEDFQVYGRTPYNLLLPEVCRTNRPTENRDVYNWQVYGQPDPQAKPETDKDRLILYAGLLGVGTIVVGGGVYGFYTLSRMINDARYSRPQKGTEVIFEDDGTAGRLTDEEMLQTAREELARLNPAAARLADSGATGDELRQKAGQILEEDSQKKFANRTHQALRGPRAIRRRPPTAQQQIIGMNQQLKSLPPETVENIRDAVVGRITRSGQNTPEAYLAALKEIAGPYLKVDKPKPQADNPPQL